LERHWVEFGHREKRTYRTKTNKLIQKVPLVSKPPEITFIVPTIGRSTLMRTITSIKNQTKINWRCIVIFDGVNIPKNITDTLKGDKRFTIIRINKVGCLNHGARVRNEGLRLVKTGWVGFVDDDDTVSPYYVEHMNNYISSNSNIKCIIFRMMYSDNNVIPKINSNTFYEGNVGISFCFNAELLRSGFYFTPSSCEDYVLLNKIRSWRYKIVMSGKIGYFVRPFLSTTIEYIKSIKHIENVMSDIIIN
jgi:glycosyltransferase involved in cell wall biosynthesis